MVFPSTQVDEIVIKPAPALQLLKAVSGIGGVTLTPTSLNEVLSEYQNAH
jgi:hypothetical protein